MARKEKTIHYLYKTTCLINNKFYIGMHSTNNMEDGYMGSGKRLRYSIRKYGIDNHKKEILGFFETREELAIREREVVNLSLIKEYLCINLIIGGEGGRGFTSEEQRLNAKKSNVKQKILRETDQDWVNKYSENLSIAQQKTWDEGKREHKCHCDWTGKKHSDETKALMKKIKKGTGVGELNSQYGTRWFSKDGVAKRIKIEEIDTFIQLGWERGIKRKM